MNSSWYKDLIDKIKSYGSIVYNLEKNVLDERKSYQEMIERNIALEKEITERTDELNQANKSLLTLKHIWGTMNSSEPLSEVLSTVVNGLSDGLGYLYCFVFQIYKFKKGDRLKIRATNENIFSAKIHNILENSIFSYDIPMDEEGNVIVQAIQSKKITNIKSFKRLFSGSIPEIEDEKLKELDNLLGNKSISILPIIVQDNPFGCLVVISVRNEISDTEKNFLSMFAGQIELAVTIANLFEQIREQAITDGLTGLFNRRHFDQCLASEVDRSIRLKQPFTLITLDLDHLKDINDTYGHPAGDAAIRHIGVILKRNARSVDIPARFGGEEFAIILPGIDIDGGMIAAERLRVAIETEAVEGVGQITASIGVATFLKHTDTLCDFLELVDQAMYRAKRNGRNRIELACKQEHEDTNWNQLVINEFISLIKKERNSLTPEAIDEISRRLYSTSSSTTSLSLLLHKMLVLLAQSYGSNYKNDYIDKKLDVLTQIAKSIELYPEEIERIKTAALLHDIGSMLMPENILLKPGPLTEDERKQVLEHPFMAAREILKPVKSASAVLQIIESHHEHWDGAGFPGNKSGTLIPLGSRILFITDAYFGMISDRPHRKALSHDKALEILRNGADTVWDGQLIDYFIEAIEKQEKFNIIT